MNEMIEDSRGVIEVADFRKMWFTFFKGESKAKLIYDMLLPTISVVCKGDDILIGAEAAKALEDDPSSYPMVSVVKLS